MIEPAFPEPGSVWQDRNWDFANLRAAQLPGLEFRKGSLFRALLDNADFSGSTFEQTSLYVPDMRGSDFSDAHFSNVSFTQPALQGANFDRITLDDVLIPETNFKQTATWLDPARRWSGLELIDMDFHGWDLSGQDFTPLARLFRPNFAGTDLSGSRFDTAPLTAILGGANLTGVDLRDMQVTANGGYGGTIFTDAEIGGATFKTNTPNVTQLSPAQVAATASYQGGDLRRVTAQRTNFSGADLSGQDLRDADFWQTDFSGADFTDADIRGTRLAITGTQLESTLSYQLGDLEGTRFDGADLSGADLRNQSLVGARLLNTQISGADLTGAVIDGLAMDNVTGFTEAQYRSTETFTSNRQREVSLYYVDVSGWTFDGLDMRGVYFRLVDGASFRHADLRGAQFNGLIDEVDFTGARIDHVYFDEAAPTESQLRSTASFAAGAIPGMGLSADLPVGFTAFAGLGLRDGDWNEVTMYGADLRETDFSGTNTGEQWYIDDADARSANLQNMFLDLPDFDRARMAGADLRGAYFSSRSDETQDLSVAADPEAIIRPDGSVGSWVLANGDDLRLWDARSADLPTVTVQSTLTLDPGAELRFVFEDTDWGSTVGFDTGATVTLDGTIALIVAPDADPAVVSGTEFQLFDWTGLTPSGTPSIRAEPGYVWDTSGLMTDGVVTLLAAASVGDFDGSGMVEQADLDLVLQNWGSPITPGTWANRRGLTPGIDQEELDIVLLNWGSTTAPIVPAAEVPEPNAALLLLAGLIWAKPSR